MYSRSHKYHHNSSPKASNPIKSIYIIRVSVLLPSRQRNINLNSINPSLNKKKLALLQTTVTNNIMYFSKLYEQRAFKALRGF